MARIKSELFLEDFPKEHKIENKYKKKRQTNKIMKLEIAFTW